MIKIKILSEKENPLLKRKDLMLEVEHTGEATPKMEDLTERIAKNFKTTPEKVDIDYIFSESGIAQSRVKLKIWKGKPPEKKIKKKEEKPKEEKPEVAEEKKPEEKEEEKPKEEKVEKPPEEPKEEKVEKPPEQKKEKPKKEEVKKEPEKPKQENTKSEKK